MISYNNDSHSKTDKKDHAALKCIYFSNSEDQKKLFPQNLSKTSFYYFEEECHFLRLE